MLERRRFLRSAAAAAAVGAVPTAALAGSPEVSGLDQHLEALFARFLQSFAVAEAADKRAEEIDVALVWPEPPAAALVRESDERLGLLNGVEDDESSVGQPYPRNASAVRRAAGLHDFFHRDELGRVAAVRAQEILDAQKAHAEAKSALLRDSGYDAAWEATTQAWNACQAHRDALATAQAATLTGVLVKAKTIALMERNADTLEEWLRDERSNCPGSVTALAVSLTLDLIRMTAAGGALGAAASMA